MDSVQRADDRVRRYVLEAAKRDPRYLPILPALFTLSDTDRTPPGMNPTPATPYNQPDAKETYSLMYSTELQRFFDPAVSVDPTEIKQFLPYLHSDPNRIIGRGIESEPRSATNVKEESQCHGAAVTVGDGLLDWNFKTVTLGGVTIVLFAAIAAIAMAYV